MNARASAPPPTDDVRKDALQVPATLDHWEVTLLGSLTGRLLRPGSVRDGQEVRTGAVSEVRFVGEQRQLLAVTETGACYLLGELAPGFLLDDAENWVHEKMRNVTPLEWQALPTVTGSRDEFGLHQPR